MLIIYSNFNIKKANSPKLYETFWHMLLANTAMAPLLDNTLGEAVAIICHVNSWDILLVMANL